MPRTLSDLIGQVRGKQARNQYGQTLVPLPPQYRWEPAEKGELDGRPYADVNANTVYADRSNQYGLAHEIGHILDKSLTDRDRAKFQRIMHMGGPWDQGTDVHGGYHSPSEGFADYYAAAATGLDLGRENVGAYTQFKAKRLRRFSKALTAFGQQNNLRQYGSDGIGKYHRGK